MKNKSIDAYIASQPVAVRKMLRQMRSIIRSVVLDAEVISYQVQWECLTVLPACRQGRRAECVKEENNHGLPSAIGVTHQVSEN